LRLISGGGVPRLPERPLAAQYGQLPRRARPPRRRCAAYCMLWLLYPASRPLAKGGAANRFGAPSPRGDSGRREIWLREFGWWENRRLVATMPRTQLIFDAGKVTITRGKFACRSNSATSPFFDACAMLRELHFLMAVVPAQRFLGWRVWLAGLVRRIQARPLNGDLNGQHSLFI